MSEIITLSFMLSIKYICVHDHFVGGECRKDLRTKRSLILIVAQRCRGCCITDHARVRTKETRTLVSTVTRGNTLYKLITYIKPHIRSQIVGLSVSPRTNPQLVAERGSLEEAEGRNCEEFDDCEETRAREHARG